MPWLLGLRLFRTGQWRKAIENARKVLVNEDTLPVARAAVALVPAMIGVLRGERRHANARLAEALLQLRANNVARLNLGARTIEMHVSVALERLNCRTRSEAVSRAIFQGLFWLKDQLGRRRNGKGSTVFVTP